MSGKQTKSEGTKLWGKAKLKDDSTHHQTNDIFNIKPQQANESLQQYAQRRRKEIDKMHEEDEWGAQFWSGY